MTQPETPTVWIAEVGSQDTEFFAGGTDTTVTVHHTRDGAARSIRQQFLNHNAPIDVVVQVGIDAVDNDHGMFVEDVDGWQVPADPDDPLGDGAVRFIWTWQLYQRPVLD